MHPCAERFCVALTDLCGAVVRGSSPDLLERSRLFSKLFYRGRLSSCTVHGYAPVTIVTLIARRTWMATSGLKPSDLTNMHSRSGFDRHAACKSREEKKLRLPRVYPSTFDKVEIETARKLVEPKETLMKRCNLLAKGKTPEGRNNFTYASHASQTIGHEVLALSALLKWTLSAWLPIEQELGPARSTSFGKSRWTDKFGSSARGWGVP